MLSTLYLSSNPSLRSLVNLIPLPVYYLKEILDYADMDLYSLETSLQIDICHQTKTSDVKRREKIYIRSH